MKDFDYYRANRTPSPEIEELEKEEWTWKIPEGKTEITKDDLNEIRGSYNTYSVQKDRKLAHMKEDLREQRMEEFYQDICKDEQIDPNDPRVQKLFLLARSDNPFSIALLYERFIADIKLFIKYDTVVQNGGESSGEG